MQQVSPKQAQNRLRTLPTALSDYIFSEEEDNLIETIGVDNHLSDEKISGLARILNQIFLGFIYYQDLQKELEQTLHLNHQAAVALAQIVNEKIINRYQSDLEKIYRPLDEKDFGLEPDRRAEDRNPVPKPVLMKETPGPAILRKEEVVFKPGVPRPVPKPGMPVPKPEAKIPVPAGTSKPATPSRPSVLSPFSFEKQVRPLNTPTEFKLGGIPKPNMANIPAASTPPKTARVELGKEEVKKAPISETKVVGREPVHYTEPKSAFMPGLKITPQEKAGPKPAAPPNPPAQANKKIDVPMPVYPRPVK